MPPVELVELSTPSRPRIVHENIKSISAGFVFLPVQQPLQDFLAKLDRTSTLITVRDDGTPWPSEKEMQTCVSHYIYAIWNGMA